MVAATHFCGSWPTLCIRELACYALARMQEVDDGELVRSIWDARGDLHLAERELCVRFAPRIRLYGLKHLKDRARADDFVQHVLALVLVGVRERRLKEPSLLSHYVLGTCRHALSGLRKGEQTQAAVASAQSTLLAESVALPPLLRVRQEALFRCLEGLAMRSRQVLAMSFMEERDAQEIAGLLGTTVGNVRVLRHRALGKIQDCLGVGEREP